MTGTARAKDRRALVTGAAAGLAAGIAAALPARRVRARCDHLSHDAPGCDARGDRSGRRGSWRGARRFSRRGRARSRRRWRKRSASARTLRHARARGRSARRQALRAGDARRIIAKPSTETCAARCLRARAVLPAMRARASGESSSLECSGPRRRVRFAASRSIRRRRARWSRSRAAWRVEEAAPRHHRQRRRRPATSARRLAIARSAMRRRRDNPRGRPGSYEDVADAVRFFVAQERDFVTGAVIEVTGGLQTGAEQSRTNERSARKHGLPWRRDERSEHRAFALARRTSAVRSRQGRRRSNTSISISLPISNASRSTASARRRCARSTSRCAPDARCGRFRDCARRTRGTAAVLSARDGKLEIEFEPPIAAGRTCDVRGTLSRVEAAPRLFFVKPTAEHPEKIAHVWTQSQDQYARYWFPCLDYPHEKQRTPTTIVVPKGMFALGNGELVERRDEGERTIFRYGKTFRTARYLMTMVAGPFVEVAQGEAGPQRRSRLLLRSARAAKPTASVPSATRRR